MSFKFSNSVRSTALVCAFAAPFLISSCQKSEKSAGMAAMGQMEVPVRAVSAVSGDVPLEVNAVGNVEAVTTVDVKSRVAGQVLRVDFEEGQDVRAGELLFEIDGEPLRRQIAELEADVAKDHAQESQARANVVKDEASLKQVRSAADRAVSLAKDGIFSKEQTEQSVATADTAQAGLDADRAAVESAMAASKADRARLAQTSLQLSYTKITAPITGRAGAISVKAGNLIKDNDASLVTILQVSPIYVTFGVPEQILPEVRQYNHERPLQIEASAADQQPEIGKLEFIDSSVDTTTGTIKLKAAFSNADRRLWPGQFVNVKARLSLEHNRIIVPSRTLQTGPEGKYVWIVNPSDHSVTMRPVDVLRLYQGPKDLEEAVVGKGLNAGEMVISEGQMRLMPGAKVRLLKSDSQLSDAAAPSPAGSM